MERPKGILTKHLEEPLTEAFVNPADNRTLLAYFKDVRAWHGYVRFLGLPAYTETGRDVPLFNLFVEPAVTREDIPPDAFDSGRTIDAKSVSDAVAIHQRLVLLGDPGFGKSTVVNWICESFTAPIRAILQQTIGPLVPIPFILREIEIPESIGWNELLSAFLRRPIGTQLRKRKSLINHLLKCGQAYILLDGIDELGSSKARHELRNAVWEGMDRYPRCRWLMTSRVVGYEEVPFHTSLASELMKHQLRTDKPLELGLLEEPRSLEPSSSLLWRADVVYLAPFDDERISRFAQLWWLQHRANTQLAQVEQREFLEALRSNANVQTLARVPNLLTLIALVYKVFVQLPDGRTDLYRRISLAYLENIDRHYRLRRPLPFSATQMERWLARVAWEMQKRRAAESRAENKAGRPQQVLIIEADAEDILMEAIARDSVDEPREIAKAFLDFAGRRSGLFLPRGEGFYAFMHLSFLEFYAAVYLEQQVSSDRWVHDNFYAPNDQGDTSLKALREDFGSPIWREVLVFLFEMLSERGTGRASHRLRLLLGANPYGSDWPTIEVAANEEESSKSNGTKLTHAGAILLAQLSVNPHIDLALNERDGLWHSCALWLLEACKRERGLARNALQVSRVLLSRRASARTILRVIGKVCADERYRKLDLAGDNIVTLDELGDQPLLEEFGLSGAGRLESLTWLTKAPKLKGVTLLELPALDNIGPISSAENLTSLDIDGFGGRIDFSPLTRCERLEKLALHEWTNYCLTALDGRPLNLASLQLNNWHESVDLAGVAAFGSLDSLDILFCEPPHNWEALTNVATLKALFVLSSYDTSAICGMAKLRHLERLTIYWDNDVPIEPLLELHELRYVHIFPKPSAAAALKVLEEFLKRGVHVLGV